MKTLKPFVRSFSDPIYRVSFVAVCCAPGDIVRKVRLALRQQTDASSKITNKIATALQASVDRGATEGAGGVAFRIDPDTRGTHGPFAVIWARPGSHEKVIVHEAWHVAFWVFRNRGVNFHSTDDVMEPMAYYLEWLVNAALGG